jgi:hypothetical protein
VNRPVLLKRGFAATIEELLMAAEHVMANGNPDVILCERGIRAVGQSTRFTLDVAAVPMLKAETHLPVLVDPKSRSGPGRSRFLARARRDRGRCGRAARRGTPGSGRGPIRWSPVAHTGRVRRVDAEGCVAGPRGRPRVFHSCGGRPGKRELLRRCWLRLREDIEGIDREIIHLLSQRVEIARHAGDVKRSLGVPVVDPVQESEVLERARRLSEAAWAALPRSAGAAAGNHRGLAACAADRRGAGPAGRTQGGGMSAGPKDRIFAEPGEARQ